MTWARFDDNYDSNPKIIAAGRDAKNLHEASIRWSCRTRTKGIVLKAALAEIAVLAQLPGRKSIHRLAAERLVALNLWEDHGEEWHVHDFGTFAPPQRFLTPVDRHDSVTENHAAHDPDPTRPVPVVSLEQLRGRVVGRGGAPDTVSCRLAELQQVAEGKGARSWIPYVQMGYQGGVSLFDLAVRRWLEEDKAARKKHETLPPFPLPSKAMPA